MKLVPNCSAIQVQPLAPTLLATTNHYRGELTGSGSAEYNGVEYPNLKISEINEVNGEVSFKVSGTDDQEVVDYMTIWFYDETEDPGELEGSADGEVAIYEPNVAGTFEGERQ